MATEQQQPLSEHEKFLQANNIEAADEVKTQTPPPTDAESNQQPPPDVPDEPFAGFNALPDETKQVWTKLQTDLEAERQRAWQLEKNRRAAESNVAPMQRQNAELQKQLD